MGSVFQVRYNLKTLKVLYNYGVKVWAGDLSQGLNYRLDQILISNFFSTTQLGLYVVAQSIANFTTILANSFKTILLPIVAKTPAFKEKIRTISQTLRKFNLVNTAMLVVSIVLVPFLLVWVYGKAFKQSELLAILLLCGFYFLNIKTVMTAAVQGLGRPFYVSISDFAGLFVLLILVYPLSKWYGINGAAIAVGISYMAQFISIYILYKKIASKTIK
jgi:O-antigen/teichoic acid export membrane protein